MWECECGNIEYGEDTPPEECKKCFKLNSFVKIPDEIAAERKRDMEDIEDMKKWERVRKEKNHQEIMEEVWVLVVEGQEKKLKGLDIEEGKVCLGLVKKQTKKKHL
jgi:hypothetical protein